MTDKTIITVGKRKLAKARASIKKGKGVVRINKITIDSIMPKYFQMNIKTPILIAGEDILKNIDIDVTVVGGGTTGQSDAVRQAIALALVKWTNNEELKKQFIAYDKNMLVADSRKNEPSKFSRSSAGPRRKRQSSKR
jgi:small subunit ribosomal protein S9